MLSAKENWLRTVQGDIPEFVPSSYDPYMKPVGDELLTPNAVPAGVEFVTALGVTYVGCNEANNGAMPKPGSVVIDDITKWRDQLKIRATEGRDWEGYYKSKLENIDRSKYLVAVSGGDYFLTLVSLLGFENAMLALYEEPDEVKALLTEISEFYLMVMKEQLRWLKPDVYGIMDDDAAFRAPFFSVATYREFFKPFHKRHCDLALENGCIITRHDCGKSEQFIDDWLELGIVSWNPFQVSNDCVGIKRKYGDRLTLNGGWDNVAVLDYTDEELLEKLEEYTENFVPGGRFIFAASAGGVLRNNPHQAEIIRDFYEKNVRNYYKTH